MQHIIVLQTSPLIHSRFLLLSNVLQCLMACVDAGTGGAQLEKGQGTAIVTGAISIIFGVSENHFCSAVVSIHPSNSTMKRSLHKTGSYLFTIGRGHNREIGFLSYHSIQHMVLCDNRSSGLIGYCVLQVLYLVLVQLLDTRGNQLEPPPPEAFEQGFLHVISMTE